MAFPVKIIEKCRVSPPSGSVSNTSLPLTLYDFRFLNSPSPIQRLFFYEFNCSNTLFTETIIPGLKTSLSLTLQHFFPLVGSLAWPKDSIKPEIVYKNGDSVSFTVCESDYDFHHLTSNHERNVEVLFCLVPQLIYNKNSNAYPVFALQVTLFPKNGICIGITAHHSAGDGRSMEHFMKSWASVSCSKGDTSFISNSPPFYDRSISNSIIDVESYYLDMLKDKNNITKEDFVLILPQNPHIQTEKVMATFVLSASNIKKLEQWILTEFSNKNNNSSPPRFSTFVLTCAYVWICWIKALGNTKEEKEEEDGMVYLSFAIDYRRRLVPPLPLTYFGNCLEGGLAEGKRSDLVGKDGLGIAADLIKQAIKNPGWKPLLPSNTRLGVNGSTTFGIYEMDFGWGNPKKAEIASIANTGAISLTECPVEAGSVEVGMVLKKKQMEAFSSFFANTIQALVNPE